jgi:hypothetical protein
MKKIFTKEAREKGKLTRQSNKRKLKGGKIAYGVYVYKWDYNAYAFPFDGRWRPSAQEADLVAENLTDEQAEAEAKRLNILNRPKYERMLAKERIKFNQLEEASRKKHEAKKQLKLASV